MRDKNYEAISLCVDADERRHIGNLYVLDLFRSIYPFRYFAYTFILYDGAYLKEWDIPSKGEAQVFKWHYPLRRKPAEQFQKQKDKEKIAQSGNTIGE